MRDSYLAKAVMQGERRALAQAITLLESARADDRQEAEDLLQTLMAASGKSIRIGISGSPGVGKSTFIEALGALIIANHDHRIAVLAVDPTSQVSGGSILGDRVRMEELSKHERVFIRPSPSGTTLGGVARHTREAIIACEAGGYDVVLVETVGVGQSETMVASMVDLFLILHLPNSGDEIQGMKKGILELADIVAVTKADGALMKEAKLAKSQLEQALSLTATHESGATPVLAVSSTENQGIKELWKSMQDLLVDRKNSGAFADRRSQQAVAWFHGELGALLHERLKAKTSIAKLLADSEKGVRAGKLAPSAAAAHVMDQVLSIS